MWTIISCQWRPSREWRRMENCWNRGPIRGTTTELLVPLPTLPPPAAPPTPGVCVCVCEKVSECVCVCVRGRGRGGGGEKGEGEGESVCVHIISQQGMRFVYSKNIYKPHLKFEVTRRG